MDDLLDFTASESELGKPVMDDLRNGLLNAPALLALESSYGGDMRSAVQALFKAQGQDFDAAQSPQAIQTALADIQRVMSAAGVFDKTRALAQSRVDQAIDALGFLPRRTPKTP